MLQQDITACAADDHLNVIATVATSDGGIGPMKMATATTFSNGHLHSNDGGELGGSHGTPQVGPSSSVHLWDAEVMTLLGTLLFPCLPLTRANAASACSVRHPNRSSTNSIGGDSAEGENDDVALQNTTTTHTPEEEVLTATVTEEIATKSTVGPESPTRRPATESTTAADGPTVAARLVPPTPSPTAAKEGTGIDTPVLVTALTFLSPYPLLAGASTGGAVALWRVPECVCVQVDICRPIVSHMRVRKRGIVRWRLTVG